ncbi:MAG: ATP-binding protein, partial [Candidatus Omnitrophica bacterium]|nr:ATP-binding protein [Candidatus Omnitrophota bacterium]
PLYLDRQLIQQAILNLINNSTWAIKEKKTKESGQITITTEYDQVKNEVILSVSDNGIGIDPEILEHIFEPFFTTKEVDEGTGLGLTMVYNIVQRHNGKIEVKSNKGEGTTFIIRFPIS